MEHTVSKFPEQKEALYKYMKVRLSGQVESCPHVTANLANASALLNQGLKEINWVGFYLLEGETLVLGPFQGPVACTRIRKGRGVCGTAGQEARTLVVPDVDAFPGHIACSSLSRSEIVVPLTDGAGAVWGELDVDSSELNTFDEVDARCLEEVCRLLRRNADKKE